VAWLEAFVGSRFWARAAPEAAEGHGVQEVNNWDVCVGWADEE
jgi:hypothetical protein